MNHVAAVGHVTAMVGWQAGVGRLALAGWRWQVSVGWLALAGWRWQVSCDPREPVI